ncbi:phosphoribosyl-AMP cyclohydrolase [bacterium]|nr:MAG: phosphoribosyl-AMP cyclohydrolase [bacterium]
MLVLRPDFEKRGGLVTVVAQDAATLDVLMVAYTDEAGWRNTLETGLATYYSTSRKESWVKGETSDNRQRVVGMRIDCDGDALIYFVEPQGHRLACHLDSRSCFAIDIQGNFLMDIGKMHERMELGYLDVAINESFKRMALYEPSC